MQRDRSIIWFRNSRSILFGPCSSHARCTIPYVADEFTYHHRVKIMMHPGCDYVGQTKRRSNFDSACCSWKCFRQPDLKAQQFWITFLQNSAFSDGHWAIPMHELLGKAAWFSAFILTVLLLQIPVPCAALSENGARNLTHTCHPACPSHLHHITSDLRALTGVRKQNNTAINFLCSSAEPSVAACAGCGAQQALAAAGRGARGGSLGDGASRAVIDNNTSQLKASL